MNKLHLLAAAAALGLAAATPASAKVNVIQSPSAALARGSTFAWAPVACASASACRIPRSPTRSPPIGCALLTEFTLTNKGYRQVADPSQADLLVAYTIVIVPEDGEANTTAGTLVLDLIERASGRLVWRATSEKRVTGKDVSQEKLVALLRQMTRSLPAR